jgi:hypothetical protein
LLNCRSCRKPFTVKIGTVFQSSHAPLHIWLQTIYLFCSSKKGFATRQLQRTLGCSMKTAWFLGHRVREAMTDLGMPEADPLGGQNQVVEADETYVGGKAANRKNKIPPKAIVLSLVQRGGKVRSFHVPNVTAETLKPVITANVDKATYLMTDGNPVYPDIGDVFAGHGWVNHSDEEYVRAYFLAYQYGREFFLDLQARSLWLPFPLSEAHLHRYAAERDFVYNHRKALGFNDQARADRTLVGVKGKRLNLRNNS